MIDPIDIARALLVVAALLFVCWLLSTDRSSINWRAVFIG